MARPPKTLQNHPFSKTSVLALFVTTALVLSMADALTGWNASGLNTALAPGSARAGSQTFPVALGRDPQTELAGLENLMRQTQAGKSLLDDPSASAVCIRFRETATCKTPAVFTFTPAMSRVEALNAYVTALIEGRAQSAGLVADAHTIPESAMVTRRAIRAASLAETTRLLAQMHGQNTGGAADMWHGWTQLHPDLATAWQKNRATGESQATAAVFKAALQDEAAVAALDSQTLRTWEDSLSRESWSAQTPPGATWPAAQAFTRLGGEPGKSWLGRETLKQGHPLVAMNEDLHKNLWRLALVLEEKQASLPGWKPKLRLSPGYALWKN